MPYIQKYWSLLGGLFGISIILILIFRNTDFNNIQPWLWIHLALLMFHQFEEYTFPGGFKKYFNKNIITTNSFVKNKLSDSAILIVNIMLGWTVYLLSAVLAEKALYLVFGLIFVSIGNGIVHTSLTIVKKTYCPGVITALFLFLPFGVFMISKFGPQLTQLDLLLSLLLGVVASLSLVVIINRTKKEPVS